MSQPQTMINILPNGLMLNVSYLPIDGLNLDSGSYISSEFVINDSDLHAERLKALLGTGNLIFTKRGTSYCGPMKREDGAIRFPIYSKLPEGCRFKLERSPNRNFSFYQDIVDTRYVGDATATYDLIKDEMKFELPSDIILTEPQPFCYNYPEAVLWDLLEFLSVLSNHILTEGFEEGIIVGPGFLEI